ncbi:carbon-nitrogen hydrolase family protein [Kutzneria kofuensis]|uniref:Putative amidohydrolase n=1 Tax=Kutzneria kofuensis TaxID=103725 RepID=A0A7W9NFF6_9PSEU|nr:carbon-nitrogen hydrolase family protein [Kutzneria kofuensis]MBB5891337.1 putative amidohydrolase [Kutzneria kofuensis]
MGERTVRIACWQSNGAENVDAGLDALDRVAERAAAQGAQLLVTPEMSLTGYQIGRSRLLRSAEPADGPMCRAVAEIAQRRGIAVVFGWPEAVGDAVYNSVQLVDSNGAALATYRKTHLYGAADKAFTPGERGVVQAELNGLTVGLLICYDVEFPEAVRAHALAGTQLLVVPTALMRPWEIVAELLVRARAFESQLFIAYTNRIGGEGTLRYCGLSRVVAPDGQVLVDAGDQEELLVADVDPTVLAKARAETTYLTDRRPELFSGR